MPYRSLDVLVLPDCAGSAMSMAGETDPGAASPTRGQTSLAVDGRAVAKRDTRETSAIKSLKGLSARI